MDGWRNLTYVEQMWHGVIEKVASKLPDIGVSFVILLVFWLLGNLLDRFIRRLGTQARVNPDILALLAWSGKVTVLAVGIVTACGTMGIDVGALLAGLGLTGFAIGFALKDIISNWLSGILILIYEPFRRGDHVSVANAPGLEGTVVAIDFRYTSLEKDGKLVLVPNANLFVKEIIVTRPAKEPTE
ncbi:MAG TPA: mechanosensitive ion channel domain-containing protein [Pirellulales bacterium]|nr:mechanosensitive ion channel domain-containing protein [Pirellulales bacterium]